MIQRLILMTLPRESMWRAYALLITVHADVGGLFNIFLNERVGAVKCMRTRTL